MFFIEMMNMFRFGPNLTSLARFGYSAFDSNFESLDHLFSNRYHGQRKFDTPTIP